MGFALRRSGAAVAVALALGLWLLCASCSNEGKANTSGTAVGKASGTTGSSKSNSTAAVKFDDDEFVRIRLEAENALKIEGSLMRVMDCAEASGGKCIEIPDKAGKPEEGKYARAVYKFTIAKPGYYTFWSRRWWLDQCGDTFAVRFDQEGRPRDLEKELIFGADDSSKPPRWGWSPVYENGKPRQFFFSPGDHVMEILNREDGPRLDLILLTNDRDYVPSDSEEMAAPR